MPCEINKMRRIRSFVCRDGRITEAQQCAINTLWPQFGLPLDQGVIDFAKVFQREAPCVLEIGFGSGHSLLAMAKAYPEQDFIGIETHQPGIGALLVGMKAQQVENIRIYYGDAVEVLTHCIPENSLEAVQLFFPDPWPKRKHHKRRLIQPKFVDLIVTKLKPGGMLHLATDWQDYAAAMMKVLSNTKDLTNLVGQGKFAARSAQRPVVTKFEQRGQRLGHAIFELQFGKNSI